MKRVYSIFLTLIFLTSTIGLTICSHYCGMERRATGLITQGCCCKKNQVMKKNCCKNEIKYIKIADDYSPSVEFNFTKKADTTPVVFCFAFNLKPIPGFVYLVSNNHSPPPDRFKDRVISFRSLLV